MNYNPYGFNSSYLDMSKDLGDPRRQEKLPGGYATQGQAVSAPYAEANMAAADDYIGGLAGKALGIGGEDMMYGLAGKLMGKDSAKDVALFGGLGSQLKGGNPFGLVGGLFG